jgi:hypothetical protein
VSIRAGLLRRRSPSKTGVNALMAARNEEALRFIPTREAAKLSGGTSRLD